MKTINKFLLAAALCACAAPAGPETAERTFAELN